MASNGDFTVKVTKKEVVAPATPLPDYWLPQSNLDLYWSPMQSSLFLCYKKPSDHELSFTYGSMVTILKKSLAQVIVPYYVFSGVMVPNSLGELELLCNNSGVDFYEARADIELQHLDFHRTNVSIRDKLLPVNNRGVFCVQATEMKCGGLVVACTFDHRIADAYSSNMFLDSWAETAQSKPISVSPSFRRSLLNPSHRRNNNHVVAYSGNRCVPLSAANKFVKGVYDGRFYYIEEKHINHLQSLANGAVGTEKKSKLVVFCAFMAKTFASRVRDGEIFCRIAVIVDGRKQLMTETNYFGNVLTHAFGKEKVSDLRNRSLSFVADKIHEFIKRGATKDCFQDLIDFIEAHRPERCLPTLYQSDGDHDDGPLFVVSSAPRRATEGRCDFGWGKPFFSSYHDGKGHLASTNFIHPMPSPRNGGRDWIVYTRMLKDHLDFVERRASHVLKPLTFDYLNCIDGNDNDKKKTHLLSAI